MSELPAHEHPPKGEWIKFAILTAVLLGTIGVIALLRPYIFGVVVPAVLGEGIEQPSVEEVTPELNVDPDAPEEQELGEDETGDEPQGEEEETEQAEEGGVEGDDAETAVDEAQTHTVVAGDTISRISRQYDVPVDSIVEANNLRNPNILRVGDELIIPAP